MSVSETCSLRVEISHMTSNLFAAVVAIEGAGMTRIVSEANNFTEVCVTISNAEAGDSATFTIRTVASGDRSKSF